MQHHLQKPHKLLTRLDTSQKKRFAAKMTAIALVIFLVSTMALSGFAQSAADAPKTFKVGMECGYAPFNWTQLDDSNGAVKIEGTNEYANGYDVQIAKKIAEHMGRELVVVKLTWEGLIPSLQSNQIDAIAAGMSATEERKKEIDFSDNYYYSDLVVVVKKSSDYAKAQALEDLAGASLTGQLGTLHYDVIDQVPDVTKEKALQDFPTMIIALQAGTIDGYISERPGAISAATANPDLTFVSFPAGEGFIFDDAEVSIGVGVKKNDPIKAEINEALQHISEEERETVMKTAISNQPVEDGGEETFFSSVASILERYWSHFLRGAGTTLMISIIGTIAGLLIGLLVATFKAIPPQKRRGAGFVVHKIVSIILSVYVEVFRGTPMMVQSMVFYYGYAYIMGKRMAPMLAGILILSINTGAYMSEVVRGGIESVDKGQLEAGKAIGMTHGQTMSSIVLPQAIRNILPATGNEFVINIKDTSVLNVIQVSELFYAASDVRANTLKIFESFFIVAVVYLVLTFTVTRILRYVERKMDGPQNYVLTSSTTPATLELHQKQGGK